MMRRWLAPMVSVCGGLVLTALALAALPVNHAVEGSAAEVPYTYGEKMRIIGRTVWERVLLPRSPAREEGYSQWRQTLERATPLLLAGLAITLAFRANVLNIGAQGQYVVGAIAGVATGIYWKGPMWMTIPLHLLAAMGAGALLAAMAALLERWRRVPVVLSTLMLNFVAFELLRYLLQGPMRPVDLAGAAVEPQSAELPGWARLPPMFEGVTELAELPVFPGWGWAMFPWAWRLITSLYPPIWIAVIAAAALGLMLRWTTFGFRLKVVGQNPIAARFAGMNVPRIAMVTLALSGALAGLAGMVGVAGVAPYVLYPDRAGDGVGFTAIAVALLGRLSAMGTVFSALFFAFLSTAFKALERSDLAVHSSTAQAVQGGLILALLITTSGRWMQQGGGVARKSLARSVEDPNPVPSTGKGTRTDSSKDRPTL